MTRSIQILLLLFINSSFAQNIWEPISFPDSLYSKAMNAQKEGLLFVATGEDGEFHGLFRSWDCGNTWEFLQVDSISEYVNIFTIRYNSEGILFVGANGAIYRSYNDGDSFTKVYTNGDNILKINFSPLNEIYAAGWTNIIRSSDNGNTWDTLIGGNNCRFFSDIDFGLNGQIYAVGWSFAPLGGGFYRSLDHGISWENIGITDLPLQSLRVNNDGVIIVGQDDYQVYISDDQGATWTNGAYSIASVLEKDSYDHLFAGGYMAPNSGCRFSDNWSNSWINLDDAVLNNHVNQISISPSNTVYIQSMKSGSSAYQLFKSINPILNTDSEKDRSDIQIYPNPSRDKILLTCNSNQEIIQYSIFNIQGQRVTIGVPINKAIDVSHLQQGIYIIEFKMEGKIAQRKLVKE